MIKQVMRKRKVIGNAHRTILDQIDLQYLDNGAKLLRKIRALELTRNSRTRLVVYLLCKRKKAYFVCRYVSEKLLDSKKTHDEINSIFICVAIISKLFPATIVKYQFDNSLIELYSDDELNNEALNNLGLAHYKVGDLKNAVNIYEFLLSQTETEEIWLNAALILSKKADGIKKALDLYEQILIKYERPIVALGNLGRLYTSLGYHEKGRNLLKEVVQRDTKETIAISSLSNSFINTGNFDEANKLLNYLIINHPEKVHFSNALFCLNYMPALTNEVFLDTYQKIGDEIEALLINDNLISKRKAKTKQNRKINIGLFSGDFKRHSVAMFLDGFIALESCKNVNLFAVSSTDKYDDLTFEFKQKFGSNWVDLNALNSGDAMLAVQNLDLDVAIDLSGHTGGNRMDLFANRVAPVQYSGLGFNCTTGLSFIDYLITFPDAFDEKEKMLIKEKTCEIKTLLPIAKTEYLKSHYDGHQTDIKVICCSRAVRLNQGVMTLWLEICKQTGAVLELNSRDFATDPSRKFFMKRFSTLGFNNENLIMKFSTPIEKAYYSSNLTLDCFPHNSGTTLYESVLCGVPFVTLRSRTSVGRFGAHIAKTLGEEQMLVANSREEYIEKSVNILMNKEYQMYFRHEVLPSATKKFSDPKMYATELFDHIKNTLNEN